MHTIFRLVPHAALRAVQHVGSHFLAPMRRQAVQEDRRLVRTLHHGGIHGVSRKGAQTRLLLLLMPHRGPHVGVHHMRPVDRLGGITCERHFGGTRGALKARGVRLKALGACECEFKTQHRGRVKPGVGHVIAVADPCDLFSLITPEKLIDREQVSENLTRMLEIGEPVDHGHICVKRKLFDFRVRIGAHHDAVHHAREHTRGVGNRFAAAELNVARREKEWIGAQLPGAHFKRHARARGRFEKDHRQRLALKRAAAVLARPHTLGERKERVEFRLRKVGNREEVAMRAVRAVGHGSRGPEVSDEI